MTKSISAETLNLSLIAEMTETTGQPTEETPFKMLILGDFSGRDNRQANELGDISSPVYRALPVDFKSLDQFMNRLTVQLILPALKEGGTTLSVMFQTLEYFQPDRLVRKGKALPALMSLHQRLPDHSTFKEASAEMQAWGLAPSLAAPPQESKPGQSTSTASSIPPPDQGDLLVRC